MSQSSVRRFQAGFGSVGEATKFLARFRGIGRFERQLYTCSNVGSKPSTDGIQVACISLNPFLGTAQENEIANFDSLLANANAVEIKDKSTPSPKVIV